ncbi:MAG: chemotaxis protein CheW [Chloroflexaceae bacterium]|nr:chemotaxis protein CheW [Chloroflexaceae bacterium]
MTFALPAETTRADGEQTVRSYLLVRVSHERYTILGTDVREVTRWREPVPVPGSPPVLPGILNQRGIILPVVDLRLLLDLPVSPPERTTRYVITHRGEVDLAFLVDEVIDLVNLAAHQLEAIPDGLDSQQSRLLQSLTRLDDQPVAVLELEAVINTLQNGF